MTDDHRTYLIGACRVTIGPTWTVTRWPDGAELHAHPDGTEEQAAIARSLGYGDDVGRMNADHDALHTLLAVTDGHDHSPTLRGVAEGRYVPRAVSDAEEARVLLVQRLLQVGLHAVLADNVEVTPPATDQA